MKGFKVSHDNSKDISKLDTRMPFLLGDELVEGQKVGNNIFRVELGEIAGMNVK